MKKSMHHPIAFAFTLLLAGIMYLGCPAKAGAQPVNVPAIAGRLVAELDSQIAQLLGQTEPGYRNLRIIVTTPANLNNLEDANPLSRQMSEEMACWLVNSGYQVQEIRRGGALLFDPEHGEFLLTRKRDLLAESEAMAGAVLTGTYTITPRCVRFNIRLLELATGETLAMSNATIPLTGELRALLADSSAQGSAPGAMIVRPSVGTRLNGGTQNGIVADASVTPASTPEPVPPSPFNTRAY